MPKEYLKLKQDDCKNCYRCIRDCPVKAITFSDRQARIRETECMLCGRCFVSCPRKAKEIRSDLPRAKALVASDQPVYASIAPSFVAYFHGATIESMAKALGRLGFRGAEETALGAAMVKKRYDEILLEGKRSVLISSCCHSITLLMQKHFPEALEYLAPVISPMQAHCRDIKERIPEARTVFIGPCISKKAEADEYPGPVDCVLTFQELSDWFATGKVTLQDAPPAGEAGKTRLFPTAGGILRSMSRASKAHTYLHIEGVENCIRAIQNILCQDLSNCFIEMSACEGSCIGGPLMGEGPRQPVSAFIAVNSYAGEEDFTLDAPEETALDKNFPSSAPSRVRVSESAIEEVLRKTGKNKPEDELDCGTCGYDTCREKAAAVIRGKADITMCLPFLKEKAESFSDTIINNTPNGIIVLNESLVVQQVNRAACRILNVSNPRDILGSKIVYVLDPDIFVEVIQNDKNIFDRRMFLAEYQRHVRITIIHDRNYHVLILLLRDVTEEEVSRAQKNALNSQTVEITDQVIDKQMRVVQEIASLLGETAAETKIALTKLKDSLKGE